MNTSTISVTSAGRAGGTSTSHNVRQCPAPSSRAASTIDLLDDRKYARIQKVPKATDCATCGSATAQNVSVSPSVRRSKYSGTTIASVGIMIPSRNR